MTVAGKGGFCQDGRVLIFGSNFRSVALVYSFVVLALGSDCARPTPAVPLMENDELLQSNAGRANVGELDDPEIVPPALLRYRERMGVRMRDAHRRHGLARPPVVPVLLGELGPGGARGYRVSLSPGRCYSVIVAGESDDLEIDLELRNDEDDLLARDDSVGSIGHIEVCPQVRGQYRVIVRMYRGQGVFALQIFGS